MDEQKDKVVEDKVIFLQPPHLAEHPVHLVGPHQPVKEHRDILGEGGESHGDDDEGSHEAPDLVVELCAHDVLPVLQQARQAQEHQERVPVTKLQNRNI